MVSDQPSHAPGMLAVGFAANRFSNSFARRSRLGSPRSSASNSSSTHTSDSLSIGLSKAQSKREFAEVYKPALQRPVNSCRPVRSPQTGLVYNEMPLAGINQHLPAVHFLCLVFEMS